MADPVGIDVQLRDGTVETLSKGLLNWAMEVASILAKLPDGQRAAVGLVMTTTENELVLRERAELEAVIQAARSGSGTEG